MQEMRQNGPAQKNVMRLPTPAVPRPGTPMVLGALLLLVAATLLIVLARRQEPALPTRSVIGQLTGADWARFDPSRARPVQAGVIRTAGDTNAATAHPTAPSILTAEVWSDRAARQCTSGLRDDDALLLFRCWAAAERALELEPRLPAARFNRAVALELLGLAPLARDAYARFLEVDPASDWAVEARDRLRGIPSESQASEWKTVLQTLRAAALRGSAAEVTSIVRRFPQQSRIWTEGIFLADWGEAQLAGSAAATRELDIARSVAQGLAAVSGEMLAADAVVAIDEARSSGDHDRLEALARGHELYRRGRKTYAERLNAEAVGILASAAAEFERGRSPMRLLAGYYEATARFDAGDHDRSAEMIRQLERTVPGSFLSMRAHLLWQQGTASGRAGDLYAARQRYTQAAESFERLFEHENAARMRNFAARGLMLIGDSTAAWNERRHGLAAAARWGDARLLEVALSEAVQDAITSGESEVARIAASAALQIAPQPNPRRRVGMLVATAMLSPDQTGMRAALDRARQQALAIPDVALQTSAIREVDAAEGIAIRDTDPGRSAELLSGAIAYQQAEAGGMLPQLYLQRARTRRVLGRHDEAMDDLNHALALAESRRAAIVADELRAAYVGTVRDIYTELVDLSIERGRMEDAFAVSERSRARTLLDRMGSDGRGVESLGAIRNGLRNGTVLVSFMSAQRGLVGFVVTRDSFRVVVSPIERRALNARMAAFPDAILGSQNASANASALYDLLFGAAEPEIDRSTAIVVVPDPSLPPVPYAALVRTATRRHLIETALVTVAPSASAHHHLSRLPNGGGRKALLVGDPAFDQDAHRGLSRLPAAKREVRDVQHLYDAVVLMDAAATRRAVLDGLATADVVSIGTHALHHSRDASRSSLLLAPSDDDGVLTARDIMKARVRAGSVAVLAGCRTAGTSARSELDGLATAFLFAGSKSVVATLWDVDDAAAARLSVAAHQAMQKGLSPAESVASVQRDAIQRGDALRDWAAFQVMGAE
jgi:CHAT domain-containing protein/tetratricopeptide (TPR) repeat protein